MTAIEEILQRHQATLERQTEDLDLYSEAVLKLAEICQKLHADIASLTVAQTELQKTVNTALLGAPRMVIGKATRASSGSQKRKGKSLKQNTSPTGLMEFSQKVNEALDQRKCSKLK